eukprot:1133567-Pelagomonas_calceolata.AAC.1
MHGRLRLYVRGQLMHAQLRALGESVLIKPHIAREAHRAVGEKYSVGTRGVVADELAAHGHRAQFASPLVRLEHD